MDKEKLVEKVADTIYGFDIGDGDWVDFLPLAKKIVSMVERGLTPRAADVLPQCEKCGSSFLWLNDVAICGNPECGNRR